MKLLLITAAIVLLGFLLYFYCIMPRFTRKSQTRAFMHRLFAHRGLFHPGEGIPEIPCRHLNGQFCADFPLSWMSR